MSLCRRKLATVPPSASLKQAMDRMTAKGVRQLPVVLQVEAGVEAARREGGEGGGHGGEEDKGGYSSSGNESSGSSDVSLYVIGVLDREDVATSVR